MSIIAITNGKGGVGKSTIAINLSGALAGKNESVLLLDTDPQGTTSDWFHSRQKQSDDNLIHKNLSVSPTPWSADELKNNLLKQARNFNFTIIDCGPANDKITRTAFVMSDFAIIPVTPSPYDINSARKTIEMLREGKKSAGLKVKPYLLISRKVVGTVLAREVREALTVFNIPILKTEISQRVALCESGIEGQTINEYTPDSLASFEFNSLKKEVCKW